MFANDIGIDLGTATTLIYIAGKGIVLREPSIVAMDERNGQVLAVGDEAYTMLGKTASDIRVVRPLEDGVISDYEVTEQMLKHFFAKVNPSRVFKPRVCVCVPSAVTEVESRSVIDTVMSSGARNVYLIEEPVAAAIGAGMDITRPGGIVVLDIGGGTSDIAVLSLNGIVCKSSVKMAGNKMNAAIVRYVRSTYNVLIGDSTADRVKREIGTVWTEGQPEKTVEVKGRNLVTQEDLLAAFELVIAGTEKKGSVLTEFEKKLVAYHEVGHAMVAYKQKNTEPVQKITIVPHTQGALGYTLLMPEEDKTELRTRDELMAKIAVSMGGRAAEEVVMNTMTNGASQDIQEATGVARNMVAMFGMSDQFGMMALASRRSQYLDGGYGLDCAQDTAAAMDKAVKDILDKCYADAVNIIRENREDMDKVVAYLLEKETITGEEFMEILNREPAQAQ